MKLRGIMNKEDYVSLEVAKILEKKGYKEPGNATYTVSREGRYEFCRYITDDIKRRFGLPKMKDGCKYDTYLAPTLYEAQKWLREKYMIYISSLPTKDNGITVWYFQIVKDTLEDAIYSRVSPNTFNTYEEALNEGILEALKLI